MRATIASWKDFVPFVAVGRTRGIAGQGDHDFAFDEFNMTSAGLAGGPQGRRERPSASAMLRGGRCTDNETNRGQMVDI
jgi:hypothetical protein